MDRGKKEGLEIVASGGEEREFEENWTLWRESLLGNVFRAYVYGCHWFCVCGACKAHVPEGYPSGFLDLKTDRTT